MAGTPFKMKGSPYPDKSPLKGKKRRARKDAKIRANALEQAETDAELRKSIETKTGKTIEELKNE